MGDSGDPTSLVLFPGTPGLRCICSASPPEMSQNSQHFYSSSLERSCTASGFGPPLQLLNVTRPKSWRSGTTGSTNSPLAGPGQDPRRADPDERRMLRSPRKPEDWNNCDLLSPRPPTYTPGTVRRATQRCFSARVPLQFVALTQHPRSSHQKVKTSS